ncbi:hypothetical protein [Streptomyces sp. 142MFCol3.1]|uniref:hypothetical protein n=1 Tax=Streptomyces sp. 142MFCol3.1 TaxID=1172179 RepID=UPI00040E6AB0|nr:hypothetical protein [Streptomyces sp. 142MFCol3.1]
MSKTGIARVERGGETTVNRAQAETPADAAVWPSTLDDPVKGRYRGRAASERLPDCGLPGHGRHRRPVVAAA